MNTKKQDAIKNAYGEYWEQVKSHVSENGWINTKILDLSKTEISYQQAKNRLNFKVEFEHRPSSLQGIEDNNGWIRIESENDLPKDIDNYWVQWNTQFDLSILTTKAHFYYGEKSNSEWLTKITHWQPIIKPLNPIY